MQPEPAEFCSPLEVADEYRSRSLHWLGPLVMAAVLAFVVGMLLASCAAGPSRSYAACSTVCRRAGMSAQERRQVCAVAELLDTTRR